MTSNHIDRHKPLISALTTFYTLLVDLCYVHPSWLIVPSAETGRHPPNLINQAAARRNGFSDPTIDLAYRIPYITDEDIRLHVETSPLCYLTQVKGEIQALETDEERDEDLADEWEYARDPTFQERDDMWIGSKILVLTRGWVYGTELLYDIDNQTIRAWKHLEVSDWRDVPAYPMPALENPLYAWTRAFLSLKNIPLDQKVIFEKDLEVFKPQDDADEGHRKFLQDSLKAYQKESTLRDVYLQCGWKPDSATADPQEGELIWDSIEEARKAAASEFKSDEFQARREEWDERIWLSDEE